MADYLGINSRELISYYENGEREIPFNILEQCSNLFGIELVDFFEEDENKLNAHLHFAFRADQIHPDDLRAISDFKKIINNYKRMKRIEGEKYSTNN